MLCRASLGTHAPLARDHPLPHFPAPGTVRSPRTRLPFQRGDKEREREKARERERDKEREITTCSTNPLAPSARSEEEEEAMGCATKWGRCSGNTEGHCPVNASAFSRRTPSTRKPLAPENNEILMTLSTRGRARIDGKEQKRLQCSVWADPGRC